MMMLLCRLDNVRIPLSPKFHRTSLLSHNESTQQPPSDHTVAGLGWRWHSAKTDCLLHSLLSSPKLHEACHSTPVPLQGLNSSRSRFARQFNISTPQGQLMARIALKHAYYEAKLRERESGLTVTTNTSENEDTGYDGNGLGAPDHCSLLDRGCGMWARGYWSRLLTAEEVDAHMPSTNCTLKDLTQPMSAEDASVSQGGHGLHDPLFSYRRCNLSYFTPIEVLALLRNVSANGTSKVLFSGDSMVRQLFLRFVSYLRGDESPVIEHAAWGDITYVVYATGDALQVRLRKFWEQKKSVRMKAPPPYLKKKKVYTEPVLQCNGDCLLQMEFYWDCYEESFNKRLFRQFDPGMHIHSFMYWFVPNRWKGLSRFLQFVADHAAAVAQSGMGEYHHVYLNTPLLVPVSESVVTKNNAIVLRNRQLWRWAAATQARLLALQNDTGRPPNQTISIVDFSGLYELAKQDAGSIVADVMPRKDDKHFMCTLEPKYPLRITSSRGDAMGCIDRSNLAVAFHLLHLLLAIRQRR